VPTLVSRIGRCSIRLSSRQRHAPQIQQDWNRWNQDTVTHRYRRYAGVVDIRISLKETRHHSATQLLAAGVDLNTVAGRPPGRRPGRAQSINGGSSAGHREGSGVSL
jgi:hypothetical protein